MSQPFDAKIIATGMDADVSRLAQFLTSEWGEMQKDETVLSGFRWVQKDAPAQTLVSLADGVKTVEFDFIGDGEMPEAYAIALSSTFPELRLALLVADSSEHEWLAGIIVAHRTTWVRARFDYEDRDAFAVNKPKGSLMKALRLSASHLHGRILDDGSLTKDFDSPVGEEYECGRLMETIFSNC